MQIQGEPSSRHRCHHAGLSAAGILGTPRCSAWGWGALLLASTLATDSTHKDSHWGRWLMQAISSRSAGPCRARGKAEPREVGHAPPSGPGRCRGLPQGAQLPVNSSHQDCLSPADDLGVGIHPHKNQSSGKGFMPSPAGHQFWELTTSC